MVVININDLKQIYLNTDQTITEVENDNNIIIEGDFNKISIYPRIYMDNVKVVLYDELDDEEIEEEVYTSFGDRGRQDIYLEYLFENEKTYLISLLDAETEDLIWRGRLLSTDQTDIQNYNLLDDNDNTGIIEA
jgi:hypothetical protein